MALGDISRGKKGTSGAIQKRPHATHPKVPGLIHGDTWHPVAYYDIMGSFPVTRGCHSMLEKHVENRLEKNALVLGFCLKPLVTFSQL